MADKKIYIEKYTSFAMEGLVMDDKTAQAFKVATDEYMVAFQEAIYQGKAKEEAHKIATNVLAAQFKSYQ
ncbi:hypothetical protein [Lacticaseibacillus paracasei]|uniref:hypothetical protein n=1 Tax=Lacticaseibacillus paracasei TaxID=1597 RepID=UPI003F60B60E